MGAGSDRGFDLRLGAHADQPTRSSEMNNRRDYWFGWRPVLREKRPVAHTIALLRSGSGSLGPASNTISQIRVIM